VRDPTRIRPLCDDIARVWSLPQFTDERFGQFIINLTRDSEGVPQDPWNWEEEEWQARLDRRVNGIPF
jgi:hypothetical protein